MKDIFNPRLARLALVFSTMVVATSAACGQGRFLFNANDPHHFSDVYFKLVEGMASGPDLFVQVFAGPDFDHLVPLEPLLALNNTGALAGYPNPTSQVFVVPGMRAGDEATVAFIGFEGMSLATATRYSRLNRAANSVILTEPPDAPNQVLLGGHSITINIPEPGTLSLGLISLAAFGVLAKLKRG